jgi:hypothetical protein
MDHSIWAPDASSDAIFRIAGNNDNTNDNNNSDGIMIGPTDNLGLSARIASASTMIASTVIQVGATGSLLLFIDAGTTVRAVHWRSIECGSDTVYYYHRVAADAVVDIYDTMPGGGGVCLPCPYGTHAEPGALSCTPCPAGQYVARLTGVCVLCPSLGWWRSDLQGCRPMQDTLPPASATPLMTFAEVQRRTPSFSKGDVVQCDFALARMLMMKFEVDMLLRGDLLGRFWRIIKSSSHIMIIDTPEDPAGIAKWEGPPLWLYCCSPEKSTVTMCLCEFGPLILGNPWDAARSFSMQLYAKCSKGGAYKKKSLFQMQFIQ